MKFHVLAVAGIVAIFAAPAMADDDDHPELSGSIRAFHDVLSADWHASPGLQRNKSACANLGSYVRLADEIGRQSVPEGQQSAAWTDTVGGLRDASVALGAYCTSGLDANVEAGLSTLHDRFHDLMKAMRSAAQE